VLGGRERAGNRSALAPRRAKFVNLAFSGLRAVGTHLRERCSLLSPYPAEVCCGFGIALCDAAGSKRTTTSPQLGLLTPCEPVASDRGCVEESRLYTETLGVMWMAEFVKLNRRSHRRIQLLPDNDSSWRRTGVEQMPFLR